MPSVRGEEKVVLDSENKSVTVNLTIEVRPYSNWVVPVGIATICTLLGIILWLFFLVKRKKKKQEDQENERT